MTKKEMCQILNDNLKVLRVSIKVSQAELAAIIGKSRQSFLAIEKQHRPISWSTALALYAVFSLYDESRKLLKCYGITEKQVKNVLAMQVINGNFGIEEQEENE